VRQAGIRQVVTYLSGPRAGSGGGEIRRGNPELYVIVGLSFIGGSNYGFAAPFL